MTQKKYWLGFNIVPRIGPVRVRALLQHFGDLETAWSAGSEQLLAVGLDQRALQNLLKLRASLSLDDELDKVEKAGVRLLTWEDESYPRLLRQVEDAPPVLYIKGELSPADEWAIAVVGTRRATSYGREIAHQFAADLAHNNISFMSIISVSCNSTPSCRPTFDSTIF